jgi:uncharacterized protein (DUF305 family)
MGRNRFGWWVVVALLAAGCGTSEPTHPVATDQTDEWFMQHMVPYLRQTAAIVSLTREHMNDPTLARLADTVTVRTQADIDQLQGWLDQRGLAPHGHSHQQIDNRGQTDMERLSRLRGTALDLAVVQVLTARSRIGVKLAGTEASNGTLPEVRQLARKLLAEQQAQARQMASLRPALTKASIRRGQSAVLTGRRPGGIAGSPRCRRRAARQSGRACWRPASR